MTKVTAMPQYEVIPGTVLKKLVNHVRAYLDVLGGKPLDAFPGFICDEESTPWNGENSIAGLFHDLSCRIDSGIESKVLAARIYLELQKYEDDLRDGIVERKIRTKVWDWGWRYLKAGFVVVWPSFTFWKKYRINATAEEML